ncbi:MAG: hypothetical protein IJW05_02400 [Lentisphaeria bacterium]|nr:hypothetical protein [Lentisphaeria bacterium]
MAEDIQGLLNRIQADGIEKAEAQKQQILSEAKRQAEEIISKAKAEAAEIIKNAEAEAEISENKGKASVKQAARDVLLSLQADLDQRLKSLVQASLGEALTPEVLGKIVLKMAEKYLDGATDDQLEILLSPADAEALEAGLKAGVLSELKNKPEIKLSNAVASGLKIGIKGSDLYFDFSNDALTEVICNYAGPKLAAAIKN